MATLEGMSLFGNENDSSTSGGAFALNRPSPVSQVLATSSGWTVEVKEGSRSIVARGGRSVDYEQACIEAVRHAQIALDSLSIRGLVDLTLHRVDDDNTVWWLGPLGIYLRIAVVQTDHALQIEVESRTEETHEQQIASASETEWHPSYRYFRLSQITDDVFDAFRNLYLALESILDYVRPVQKLDSGYFESESKWLMSALKQVGELVDLRIYALPGHKKPESIIFEEIYEGRRNPIFHAKSSRSPLMPGEDADRTRVVESLRRLAGLYLDLAQRYLGLQRPTGSLFSMMFHQMLLGDQEVVLFVSDLDNSQAVIEVNSPPYAERIVRLDTERRRDLDAAWLTSYLGKICTSNLVSLNSLCQIWVQIGNDPVSPRFCLDGEGLNLTGIDERQVHLGFRVTDSLWPRDVYGN